MSQNSATACCQDSRVPLTSPADEAESTRRVVTDPKEATTHQEYIDCLRSPTLAEAERIAGVQEKKEAEIEKKYEGQDGDSAERRAAAAGVIQRNFRGHRARMQLSGFGLDPSTRWLEAVAEAQYRRMNTPHARNTSGDGDKSGESQRPMSPGARHYWRHISKVAKHAHGEGLDAPDGDNHKDDASLASSHIGKKWWAKEKENDQWRGKMMDLPYYLEMVDLKHRYGSNLRAYHAEWKKADTQDNFFWWLDHGDGVKFELPNVSRQRLEREQVRYLSREERLKYLVIVDDLGRLCWHKNGERVDTTTEYRDSVEGIVAVGDKAKTFREDEIKALEKQSGHRKVRLEYDDDDDDDDEPIEESSGGDSDSVSSGDRRYPDPDEMQDAKGIKKVAYVTPAVILQRLMRKSLKKNTWIFVADLSSNLYIGIKQSGSFQHSSFMRGMRIAAAGLIKVKRGQLRSLSPLSGHYRPPVAAFKHFIEHLKSENVDMSRVSISKSYAVLLGLETYIDSKKKIKSAGEGIKHTIEKVVHPEEAEARKEREKDKSQSARLEEAKLREEEEKRRQEKRTRTRGTLQGDGQSSIRPRPTSGGTKSSFGVLRAEMKDKYSGDGNAQLAQKHPGSVPPLDEVVPKEQASEQPDQEGEQM